MKIAFFIPNLAGGGAERVTTTLANGFVEKGHRIDILVIEKVGPYLADVHPAVRIVDLRKRTVRSGIFPLARHLRSEKPDVLFSAMDHANVGALLARRVAGVATCVIPVVHATHSKAAIHDRGIHNKMVRVAMRWIYHWSDAIVAVSNGVAEDMIQYSRLPRKLVRVIYNPVISPQLESLAMQPISHPWLTEGASPVILAVGRLTAAKDFPTLLRAFALLRQKKDCRLIILGEGEDRNKLEQIIEDLGLTDEVALPGFTKNPYAYLAKASLFVLSSAWEALPTVLIEALALGVPLVSTDCPNGPSEILKGGQYGHLVPVGNVEALSSAMYEALSELRSKSPGSDIQAYTIDAAVSGYTALINELRHT